MADADLGTIKFDRRKLLNEFTMTVVLKTTWRDDLRLRLGARLVQIGCWLAGIKALKIDMVEQEKP